MNITLLACFSRRSYRVSIYHPGHYALLAILCAGVVAAAGYGGYQFGLKHENAAATAAWERELRAQEEEIAEMREAKRAEVAALSNRLAVLRGRFSEIDALGRKLVKAADLDLGELDFDNVQSIGGPLLPAREAETERPTSFSEIRRRADQLAGGIEDRKRKLSVVEGFMVDRELKVETTPAGWPIDSGWISSSYGHRTDPITGNQAFHSGTDFATHTGDPVHAIAGGVVTFSGRRGAYGNLVEINHGNGYTTRYAHNKENLVRVGEVVRAGHKIARVGSTGRSTGPHVHLEVRKNGQPKNPAPFASAER